MKNRQVRDLAWVINSPSLIQQQEGWPCILDPSTTSSGLLTPSSGLLTPSSGLSNASQTNWVEQWLLSLDKSPEALQQHLAQEKSHFIGTYFESLWAFYLLSNPKYELIAKNLQANSKSRTVGEFDFIVFDNESGDFIHQEIAIKFYLGYRQPNKYSFSDGKNIWLGPQCKDRLDLKMDKMLNTQIDLANKESGKRALKSVNVDPDTNNIKTQLIMKGYLFYPSTASVMAPDFCNPNHLKGRWCKLDEFTTHIERCDSDAWALLTKPEWVSPYYSDTNTFIAKHENSFTNKADMLCTLKRKITTEGRPWMVACLKIQANNDYLETERLFVVPEQWPNIAKPSDL